MCDTFNKYMALPQGKPFADKYSDVIPVEKVNCIICGSSDGRLWYRMGKFNSMICNECNSRYVTPRYDDRQLNEHYSEDLFTGSKDYEGISHNMLDPTERERKRKDMAIEIQAVLKNLPEGGKVLDIGCQTGIFLEALPDKYEKYGVERSKWAAEHCKKIINGKIFVGKIEDADFEEGQFDAINISYVVEHLQYPLETINKIIPWLKDDGVLIISVPNFGSLCSKVFKEFYRLADPRQHIYLTNPQGMYALFDRSGIQVKEIHYPYWNTPYCNIKQLLRLVLNSARRFMLAMLIRLGLVPKLENIISPPFWGNIMTVVAKKKKQV